MFFRPKMLVVDEDRATLRLFETALASSGAEARCLSNGQELDGLLDTESFDGIFLGWELPGLDAEKLIQRVRRSCSNAKVPITILVDGKNSQAIAKAFRAGATLYLAKPVSAHELQKLLSASLGAIPQERRRYQRVRLDVPVHCRWGQGQRTSSGKGLDISTVGMLMALEPHPPVGTSLEVELELPGARQGLLLKGLVARAEPPGKVALDFTSLSGAQAEALEAYIRSLA